MSDVVNPPPAAPAVAPTLTQPVSSSPATRRLWGLALLVPCLSVLIVAWVLTPDARGHGTHEALGLPACNFLQRTSLPCATCGYTTATSLAVHGRLAESAATQPGGLAFALLMAAGVWVGGWAAAAAMPLGPVLRPLVRPVPLVAGGVFVLLAWGFNVARAAGGWW